MLDFAYTLMQNVKRADERSAKAWKSLFYNCKEKDLKKIKKMKIYSCIYKKVDVKCKSC